MLTKIETTDTDIKVEDVPEVADTKIVTITGYLDTYNSIYVQRCFDEVLNTPNVKNLIVNCAALTYLSSTGLGIFTTIYKKLLDRKGKLILLSISKKVYELFLLLGFSQFFVTKSTYAEAIEFLKKGLEPNDFEETQHIECPNCKSKLRITKAGRFRCEHCKINLAVDKNLRIRLA